MESKDAHGDEDEQHLQQPSRGPCHLGAGDEERRCRDDESDPRVLRVVVESLRGSVDRCGCVDDVLEPDGQRGRDAYCEKHLADESWSARRDCHERDHDDRSDDPSAVDELGGLDDGVGECGDEILDGLLELVVGVRRDGTDECQQQAEHDLRDVARPALQSVVGDGAEDGEPRRTRGDLEPLGHRQSMVAAANARISRATSGPEGVKRISPTPLAAAASTRARMSAASPTHP